MWSEAFVSLWNRVFPLCVALTLAGCASLEQRFAEQTSAATVIAPAAWATSSAVLPATSPAAIDLAEWWRQLGDAQLTQLIALASEAAPDWRTAQARLRQARAARDLADASLFPTIAASASATRARTGKAAGGSGKPQTLYAAGFDASWEPSIFGGLRDAASAAQADLAAAEADVQSTHASLVAEVALEYVTLRASQQRLSIVRANVASQTETLQITEWREMAGLTTRLDVEQARTNLEQSRAAIPSLETGRAEAEHRLAILSGLAPGSLRTALQEIRPLPSAPDEIAVGIPVDTLRQRPDMRAAEFTLRAEIARTAEKEADRYPSLALDGSFGWKDATLSALGGGSNVARSLVASFAGTLFDGGRIRSRIDMQKAAQAQAFIAWEKAILTALEDVENAMTAYANGRDRFGARRNAATAATHAAELARLQYRAGSADFQKVLETERTLLTAQDNLASAEADVLTAVIQLYKALGGGWIPTETTERSAS